MNTEAVVGISFHFFCKNFAERSSEAAEFAKFIVRFKNKVSATIVMRFVIIGIIAIVLLLAGCGRQEVQELAPEQTAPQPAPQVSAVEKTKTVVPEPVQQAVQVEDLSMNSVWVIDAGSMEVVQKIPVGVSPSDVALTDNGYYAAVTNAGENTLSVIDLTSGNIISKIEVGANPKGVIFVPISDLIVVANIDDGVLSVVNLTSQGVDATIPVSKRPSNLVASSEGKYVFVVSAGGNVLEKVNLFIRRVTGRAKVGDVPISVDMTGDKEKIFVANERTDGVSGIDGVDTRKHSGFFFVLKSVLFCAV